MASYLLAVDLGASSGRVALGRLEKGRLQVEILHRFPNNPLWVPMLDKEHLHWNILGLWQGVLEGLERAGQRADSEGFYIESLGVDAWGVDFALLDARGGLLGGVLHYRDPRTEGQMERAFARMPPDEIYRRTGLQFLPLNTLYQLLAVAQESPEWLEQARYLLLVPDLFHFWLSGQARSERTIASTTQLYNPTQADWDKGLIQQMGLPEGIFCPLVPPGHVLESLRPSLAQRLKLEHTVVVTPASHDTASAVAAVPARNSAWGYISSGTWSLVGLEIAQPLISEQARRFNFTNETGVHGTTRFLKNVMGLWILQECRRVWGASWEDLFAEAAQQRLDEPLESHLDPDHPLFLPAGEEMPQRLLQYFRQTGQTIPPSRGLLVRSVLESLALKYRFVLEQLETLTGQRIQTLHVVGGGSQIELLNLLTATVIGREVLAGPTEATLLGNLLVQAEGLGLLSPDQRRAVVAQSFPPQRFTPRYSPRWEETYQRFEQHLIQR